MIVQTAPVRLTLSPVVRRNIGYLRALPPTWPDKILLDARTGCWEWTAATNSRGYGCGSVGGSGKTDLTHRVAYRVANGEYPPDRPQTDHLCRNIRCLNPAHIEAVTAAENNRRKPGYHPDACVHGHAYTDENIKIKNGAWNCRQCANAAQVAARARNKAEGLPPGDARHGTLYGYRQFGCRCTDCRSAAAEHRAGRAAPIVTEHPPAPETAD